MSIKYPTIYIKNDEINLKTNNNIIIRGPKNTGKTLIALDIIKQYNNLNNIEIISCSESKRYSLDKEITKINLLNYLKELLIKLEKDEDLYTRIEQNIIYLDGLDLENKEVIEILNKILNKVKLSSYTFIITTRHRNKSIIVPDIIIRTNVKDNYDLLKITHQSILYNSPKVVIVEKPIYKKNLFDFMKTLKIEF